MKYMLDTNIIIYAINNRSENIINKIKNYSNDELYISSITYAELEYGVYNSSKPKQNKLALLLFLSNFKILPFDSKAAIEYGKIRYELKAKGKLIGANDLLIASHCKSLGYTLVTNNTKEFKRIDNLDIDNWFD